MKITKYDVHVHSLKEQHKEVFGKSFYMSNDDPDTLKRAITHSCDESFKPYLNNPDYMIHMVTDQELCQCEIDAFMKMISKDSDPCNFFITRAKDIF